MKRWLVVAVAACGGGPRYLGAPLPDACAGNNAEACAGWLAERDLDAGGLDVYPDAALHRYVQGIADRLARGTRLAHPPRVVISDHDGTYAAFGDRIVIGRMAIEKLGSEAELAAIVAHELVHVEGRHATVSLFGPEADARWLVTRRDAEAIADERAVTLLERAGYAPAAMSRALEAELDPEDDPDDDPEDNSDDEHPPRAERLAHVAQLADGRIDGFDGRAELLAHIDQMILGRDTRLGVRVGDAWVIAALGVALELPARDIVHVDGDAVVLRHGTSSLTAYAIGAPWARELAATLDDRAETESRARPDHRRHRARARSDRDAARTARAVDPRAVAAAGARHLARDPRPPARRARPRAVSEDRSVHPRPLAARPARRGAARGRRRRAASPGDRARAARRDGRRAGRRVHRSGSRARPRSPRPRARRRRSDQVYRPVGNTTRWIAPCSGHTSSTPSAPNAT